MSKVTGHDFYAALGMQQPTYVFSSSEMEAYAAAKVREALEEALLVAEKEWRENLYDFPYPKIIKGIRALIQNQTGDSNVATD